MRIPEGHSWGPSTSLDVSSKETWQVQGRSESRSRSGCRAWCGTRSVPRQRGRLCRRLCPPGRLRPALPPVPPGSLFRLGRKRSKQTAERRRFKDTDRDSCIREPGAEEASDTSEKYRGEHTSPRRGRPETWHSLKLQRAPRPKEDPLE